jgi:hypothetical protein
VLRNPKHLWALQHLPGRTGSPLSGQAPSRQDGRCLIRSSSLRSGSASFFSSLVPENETPDLTVFIAFSS